MDDRSEEDKLVELKEKLIGRWILNDISSDDWWEYKKSIDNTKWFAKEGLVMLLTQEMMDLMVDKREEEIVEMFDEFLFDFAIHREVLSSLVRLCTPASDRLCRGEKLWNRHRVLCLAMKRMAMRYSNEWSAENIDCVVDYLLKVLECEDMELVKWAMLAEERWWVEMKMSSERRDRLRIAITRHSQTHSDTLEKAMDKHGWEVERYQVGSSELFFSNIHLAISICSNSANPSSSLVSTF